MHQASARACEKFSIYVPLLSCLHNVIYALRSFNTSSNSEMIFDATAHLHYARMHRGVLRAIRWCMLMLIHKLRENKNRGMADTLTTPQSHVHTARLQTNTIN